MNTDGSFNTRNYDSSAGGILRNHDGTWIKGFAMKLGRDSSFGAELWGLFEDLDIAFNLGISFIEINCNASVVVQVVTEARNSTLNIQTSLIYAGKNSKSSRSLNLFIVIERQTRLWMLWRSMVP